MHNLVNNPAYNDLQAKLNKLLTQKLKRIGDQFRPGSYYVKKYNYPSLDATGTVPYMGCKGKWH